MIIVLNIILAVLAVVILLTATDAQIWNRNTPNPLRLTVRGRLLVLILAISVCLQVVKEIETNKRESENESRRAHAEMRESENESRRAHAEMRLHSLLEEKLNSTEKTLSALLKENGHTNVSSSSKIAELQGDLQRYKDELKTLTQKSSLSTRPYSYPPRRESKAPADKESTPIGNQFPIAVYPNNRDIVDKQAVSAIKEPRQVTDGQLQIITNSYHVRKKEPFIFQVQRYSYSKSKWDSLYPGEVSIQAPGTPYTMEGGEHPTFGLKGSGQTTLQVTDKKGGITKCLIYFE